MSRKAYFTGESYLGSTAKISPFDSFEGGLSFRTLQPAGLLFYLSEGVLIFLFIQMGKKSHFRKYNAKCQMVGWEYSFLVQFQLRIWVNHRYHFVITKKNPELTLDVVVIVCNCAAM